MRMMSSMTLKTTRTMTACCSFIQLTQPVRGWLDGGLCKKRYSSNHYQNVDKSTKAQLRFAHFSIKEPNSDLPIFQSRRERWEHRRLRALKSISLLVTTSYSRLL